MGKNKPVVSFDGEGVVTVVPDQAVISLAVNARTNTSLEQAVAKQAEQKASVLGLLKALSVETKNISSSGYASGPETEYDNGKQKNTGWFVVNETVTVKVPTALAGKVAGRTSKWAEVNGVQFVVSRDLTKKSREDATELAIADAEAKAQARAARLKLTLGKLVGFTEGRVSNSRPQMHRAMAFAAAEAIGGGPDADLNEGETEVSATVVLTYKLK